MNLRCTATFPCPVVSTHLRHYEITISTGTRGGEVLCPQDNAPVTYIYVHTNSIQRLLGVTHWFSSHLLNSKNKMLPVDSRPSVSKDCGVTPI